MADPPGSGAAAPDAGAVAAMLRGAGIEPGLLRLSRIPGGASREVYLVDEGGDGPGRRWVLRCDPPGASSFAPLAVEYELLEAARQAAVPAPAPLAFAAAADGALGGRDGYLMEHVPGDSVPPRLLRKPEYGAARRALAAQLGAALAKVHSIDPAHDRRAHRPRGRPGARCLHALGGGDRPDRPAAAGRRGGPALAAAQCPRAGVGPGADPRRLPARQLHRRRLGARRCDRLGARPWRRPRRGHRLAHDPLLALRQRRAAGRRDRPARALPRRLP